MPRFSKAEKEWAQQVLAPKNEHSPHVQAYSPSATWVESTYGSSHLLDQLKARVIVGETLSQADLLAAKSQLTAAEQAELRKFLGDE